ncbi:MAG: hypothetical protein Unbinned1473contig1000_24 [Prokaryotic dsDNA virus sp.]|nr:MAG: hypothetical protein Unbinned1473contig1000_24 [Prokaryotic dsDNA virus sp.]|tara:strand:+ start:3194 stop:3496 length:303 start_codon:yes stop_codon:yes gene_type:complete
MSEKKDIVFADGFILKRNDNAPDFVVGRLSIKVEEAVSFLNEKESNGWVNLELKRSKSGGFYCELDTWKPDGDASSKKASPKKAAPKPQVDTEEEEELPF